MKPEIRKLEKTLLVGKRMKMSLQNDRTGELWQQFMPQRREIKNSVGQELYAVSVYSKPDYFAAYSPQTAFEKWAAVKVSDHLHIPRGMLALEVPGGNYAVFQYRGKPIDAGPVFEYIFQEWLPHSAYTLDDRPHFALMGEKYLGDDPASEEEFWIPVSPLFQ